MPPLMAEKDEEEDRKPHEGESFDEIMDEMRSRNADRLGVNEDEFDDMSITQIQRQCGLEQSKSQEPRWKFW